MAGCGPGRLCASSQSGNLPGPSPMPSPEQALARYLQATRSPSDGWVVKRRATTDVTFRWEVGRNWREVRTVKTGDAWDVDLTRGCSTS